MNNKELNEWKKWAEEYERSCNKEKKDQIKDSKNINDDSVTDEHNNG
jgi:hypothetical protein